MFNGDRRYHIVRIAEGGYILNPLTLLSAERDVIVNISVRIRLTTTAHDIISGNQHLTITVKLRRLVTGSAALEPDVNLG